MSGSTAEGIRLESDLWLDRPDAVQQIAERQAACQLTAEQAERLRFFAEHGYMLFALDLDAAEIDALVDGVDQLWEERPTDVAFACDSPARPMHRGDVAERRARYRLHDIHSHLPAARALYLNEQIFAEVRRILGDDAVAIQSLFFEFGSEQMLHRDPVVVPTGAPGHLLASWVALEDIHPDCGALVYIPGSHRLPYYAFGPEQYMFDAATMGEAEVEAAFAFDEAQCAKHGLEPRLLTIKKGECLIWHASLRHGGGPVRDPSLTRKSFVVHYAPRATYGTRAITVFDRDDQTPGPTVFETDTLLRAPGAAGFDNPMRGRIRG